ncbi:MAG: hypothetical protein NTY53_12660 [Kiritimatiellaeota bacterium]|nr:hypothetical protein [Kiritimatiellota bacterium]
MRAEIKRLERALKRPERLMENPHLLPSTPTAPRIRTTTSATSASAPAPAPAELQASMPARSVPVSGNETFAHLFSSTRFLGPPALRHERRVQRNRALLLLAGVVILGYIVFKIIFR